MTTTRNAATHWEGGLLDGAGQVTLNSSGLGTFDVSWPARAEEPNGKTSPEELIAAAHSACFSMAFSARLAKNETPPAGLDTSAEVDFVPGTGITAIRLTVVGNVPGIDEATFVALAEDAKANCPVSQALASVPSITVSASLA
jgi:lipoyl-dependent peroxiredoxin